MYVTVSGRVVAKSRSIDRHQKATCFDLTMGYFLVRSRSVSSATISLSHESVEDTAKDTFQPIFVYRRQS